MRTFFQMGTLRLIPLILKALRRPWYRSLVLDQLIHNVHLYLLRRARPDVSFVFFMPVPIFSTTTISTRLSPAASFAILPGTFDLK